MTTCAGFALSLRATSRVGRLASGRLSRCVRAPAINSSECRLTPPLARRMASVQDVRGDTRGNSTGHRASRRLEERPTRAQAGDRGPRWGRCGSPRRGCWATATYGSIGRAVGYHLRGETLFLDSNEKSFGVIEWGETSSVTFKMINCGPAPIRILGCQSPCSCLVRDDFPFTIAGNGVRDFVIPIRVNPPADAPSAIYLCRRLPFSPIIQTNPACSSV